MDVDLVIARLQAQCPTLAQVIGARPGGSTPPAASQAALVALLQGLVGNRMYPLNAVEQVASPSIVYQLTSSYPGSFDGYDITHTDQYVLMIRGDDYDALLTLLPQIVTALDGQDIEITDMLHDFDPREQLYRVNLELSYSYLSASSQAMPAAFVYPVSRSASESAFDNYTKQRVDMDYGILLVTSDDNIPALAAEVQAALLGWQQSPDYHEMQYASGASVEGVGGMSVWREIYRDAFYITQA